MLIHKIIPKAAIALTISLFSCSEEFTKKEKEHSEIVDSENGTVYVSINMNWGWNGTYDSL